MTSFIVLISIIILLFLIAVFFLSGENLSRYDARVQDVANNVFDSHPDDAEAAKRIIKQLAEVHNDVIASKSLSKGFTIAREFADNLSYDLICDTEFTAVNANGVDCEWAVAPGSNPNNRIVFFHGGAFLFGSARGHRKFTDQLSRLANAAVLSVNYRMLPKHNRYLCSQDAQNAYKWVLENGPNGKQDLDFLMVAGDSAGGNLAHMIAAWSKHNAPRQPDGVIGISPSLDHTMASPTLTKNQKTDPILGEGLGLLLKLPMPIRSWILFISMRANPCNPVVSPVFGDLSDLPPTLIHASSSEMLLGEAIRYTNKAREADSPITLQIWKDQIHDWHLMNMGSGSANVAWNEIAKFISNLKDNLGIKPEQEKKVAVNE